jgi:hypothetical protein
MSMKSRPDKQLDMDRLKLKTIKLQLVYDMVQFAQTLVPMLIILEKPTVFLYKLTKYFGTWCSWCYSECASTVVRQTFQLAWCMWMHAQSNITNIIFTWVGYITPTNTKSRISEHITNSQISELQGRPGEDGIDRLPGQKVRLIPTWLRIYLRLDIW